MEALSNFPSLFEQFPLLLAVCDVGCVNDFLFGEDQSRYVISSKEENADTIISMLNEENITYQIIGKTIKGSIIVNNEKSEIKEIKDLYENWFNKYLEQD